MIRSAEGLFCSMSAQFEKLFDNRIMGIIGGLRHPGVKRNESHAGIKTGLEE